MKYAFFNDVDNDRLYMAEDFAAYFAKFIGNGVYASPASSMQVSAASSGLAVKIADGGCFINGYYANAENEPLITLSTANGSYGRYDLIVARLDFTKRDIHIERITGTVAESPVYPEIVRNDVQYDIALAAVYIAPNAIGINDADITDLRPDTDYCGFVTGVVDQIDTTDLFKQYQTAWELLISGMELDEPNIIKAFEALNVTKSVNSVTPADGNILLSMDNIYSGKDYPKYTVQCGTISGAETTDPQKMKLNVVYPKPFKSKPTIVASIVYDAYASNSVVIGNETAEGFTIQLQAVDHYNFNWIAVGDFVSIEIISQPADVTVASGKTATFKVSAIGNGLTYLWQVSKNGTQWFNLGSTSDTLKLTATNTNNGNLYRCIITDENGNSVNSDTATLTVTG